MATAVTCVVASSVPSAAYGGLDMSLEIPSVTGDATGSPDSRDIDLYRFSVGVSNPHGKRPDFTDLSVTKRLDSASPKLLELVGTAQTLPVAVLTLATTSGDGRRELAAYCMTGVRVTSLQQSGSAGEDDRPTETLTLRYQTIVERFRPHSEDGGPSGSPITGGWNVVRHLQYGTWDC